MWNQGPSSRIFSAISEEGDEEERRSSEDIVEVSGVVPSKDASATVLYLQDSDRSGAYLEAAKRIEREAKLRSHSSPNPIGVADENNAIQGVLCTNLSDRGRRTAAELKHVFSAWNDRGVA